MRERKLEASARVTLAKALAKVPVIPKPENQKTELRETKNETTHFKPGTIDRMYHVSYATYHESYIIDHVS